VFGRQAPNGNSWSANNDNERCDDDDQVCSNGRVYRATRLTAKVGPESNTVFSNPRIGQCIASIRVFNLELYVPEDGACTHRDIDELSLRENNTVARLDLRASSKPVKYQLLRGSGGKVAATGDRDTA